ncbi:syntaxin, putative [Candida dubliniensis CD36]|uniref:Syntaxin, putative n=1 Tax=Candida dubliniensis (strain CD36 / ATCC MYA-646 / CBS 7987 / NCPF 3949 / NRRL Y-17841) TaxID=573826 RepID=B9WHJ1_CANDC|nr:syntaxin, putative [Candida dubliniensis CD36]CAX41633.1 syntaxin, putative [Candida dubliniensis CD36]
MSFNTPFSEDLERTATNNSHRYKDYPEFDSLSTTIENQLHFINSELLSSIRSDLAKLEKDKTDTTLSESLSGQFRKTTDAFKKVNKFVKQLNASIVATEREHEDVETVNYLKQKEAIQIKLIRDSLANFNNFQKRFESCQTTQLPEDGSNLSEAEPGTAQQQQQQQQQVQITYEPINAEELEQQTLLIQEREREIHQIQQDTQEINDIFSNLSSIVNEQQFQIDSIENNIFSYNSNAREASNELRRAERYQKSSSGRLLCCFLILVGIVSFIILIGLIF